MTNIECLFVGFKDALHLKDDSLIRKSVETMLQLERNAFLEKNMSTREIEEAKIYQNPMAITPDIISKTIGKENSSS